MEGRKRPSIENGLKQGGRGRLSEKKILATPEDLAKRATLGKAGRVNSVEAASEAQENLYRKFRQKISATIYLSTTYSAEQHRLTESASRSSNALCANRHKPILVGSCTDTFEREAAQTDPPPSDETIQSIRSGCSSPNQSLGTLESPHALALLASALSSGLPQRAAIFGRTSKEQEDSIG